MTASDVITDMDTTIRVSVKTRDRIQKIGKMGDTFDSVLIRLLDDYEKHHKDKE